MEGMAAPVRVGVLVGSPRRHACSARLAQALCESLERAGAAPRPLHIADYSVMPCVGCGACEASGACVLDAREAACDAPGHAALREALLGCDALALVAPVYFSGPPSQLKAVLDRMQPFWCQRYLLRTRPALPLGARRPLGLLVLGGGGDPFGFDALRSCAHSALRMLDFELVSTLDAVGFGQQPRPGMPFGPEFDERILAQLDGWALDLVREAVQRTRPHDPDEV